METPSSLRMKIEDPGSAVKMAGYLEKRGKLKLVGSWKKYWFVLEGQLLLYYKSQLEYDNLSACRGSLNIGLASCVRPGHGHTVQIVTRTQCLTLRTKARALQEQWLQVLLDSMALPSAGSLKRQSATGTHHFRYSLDNLPAINEMEDERVLPKDGGGGGGGGVVDAVVDGGGKTATLPRQVGRQDSVLGRIKRMGGISYGARLDGSKHKALVKSSSVSSIETKSDLLEAIKQRTDRKALEARLGDNAADRRKEASSSGASTEDVANSEVNESNELKPKSIEKDAVKSAEEKRDREIAINESVSVIKVNSLNDDVIKDNKIEGELVRDDYDEFEEIPVEERKKDLEKSTDNNGNDMISCNEYSEIQLDNSCQEAPVNVYLADGNQNNNGVRKSGTGPDEMNEINHLYATTATTAEERKATEEGAQDEAYYSSYDRVAFMKDLTVMTDVEETEPDLPPRPEKEEAYYAAYEECLYEDLDITGNADSAKVKKRSNFRDKILLKDFRHHRQVKKSNSAELKAQKEKEKEESDEPKVKAKQSFLKKFVMKRKKKDVLAEPAPYEGEDEEPMYDECLFAVGRPGVDTPAEQMPPGAVNELKDKLKQRPVEDSDEDSADYDTVGSSTTTDPSLPDKPDELDSKASSRSSNEHLYAKSYKSKQLGMLEMLVTPSLPPRRGLRPTSPWHDVPTNNAPAYADSLDAAAGLRPIGALDRPREQGGTGQLVPDEVLNTPEGFLMIKNKFRQAETGREWNPELQQVTFPKKAIIGSRDAAGLSKDGSGDRSDSVRALLERDINELDSLEKSHLENLDSEVSSILSPEVRLRGEVATAELVDLSGVDANGYVDVGVNRFSDELHVLLAQLADITSAPLFHIGATKSLLAPPTYLTALDQELGPIRRRRHSDPDYDVPRPHGFAQLRFQTDSPSNSSISPDSLEPPADILS